MRDLIEKHFDKLLIMWLLHLAVVLVLVLMLFKADAALVNWGTGLVGTIVGSLLTLINARLFSRKGDTNGENKPNG